MLVEHYVEHQQRNSNLTFSDFLAMHYLDNDINDNDEERDRQLPFKNIDHHVSHFVFIPNQNRNHTPNVNIVPEDSRTKIISANNLRHNPHLGALFRPPIA